MFPLGVLVTGALFPLAVMGYWLGNNFFTNLQTRYLNKYINSPDGRWPDFDADRLGTVTATEPARRANQHVYQANKHDTALNYRLKYFHLMAAGRLAAEAFGASSTAALDNYLRAADCARFRSQQQRYQQAMSHVTPHLHNVVDRRLTDDKQRALVLYYEWVRVFAVREMSSKGAGARLATEQLPSLRKQFAVQSPVSPGAVAKSPGIYTSLGQIAAASIPSQGGGSTRVSTRVSKRAAIFASQTGAALIACGARTQGRQVLQLAATTTKESSRTRTLAAVVKAEALDYLSTQIHDAAVDTLQPIVIDAVNAGLDGIGAGVDAVRSLL